MSNHHGLDFHLRREVFFSKMVEVRIAGKTETGRWEVAEPMQMRVLEEDEHGIEAPVAMRLTPDDAQRLMDELWNVGIRPSEGSGSAGQLAAVQAHLKDMQRLVFEPPVRS